MFQYLDSSCFLVHQIPLPILNALRKIIMCDLENAGFHEKNITIIQNTTSCNNEILQHRISLIPVYVPEKHPKTLEYRINILNTDDEPKYVTSDDFICTTQTETEMIYKDIILCHLQKSEVVQAIAKIDFGCGQICYRPAANVYFKKAVFLYASNNVKKQIESAIIDNGFQFYSDVLKNDECIGFSPDLNELTDEELCQFCKQKVSSKTFDDYYAFFIDTFFEANNAVKILMNAIDKFKQKLQQFATKYLKKNHQHQKKNILYIDVEFDAIVHPLAYFLRQQSDKVKFANCDKKHPYGDIIELHIVLDKPGDIVALCEQTIIKMETFLTGLVISGRGIEC